MKPLSKINLPVLGSLSFCVLEENETENIISSISNLLSACAFKLSESEGGHVPDIIVKSRILKYYTTKESILAIDNKLVSRFIITSDDQEILATALVANLPGILMPEETHRNHDTSSIVKHDALEKFHSVFNVAVKEDVRKKGLAKALIENVCEQRFLFKGKGLYVRSEPPDHAVWVKLGFIHLPVIDEFFREDVDLPNGITEPQQFNTHFTCSCNTTTLHRKNMGSKKLKYYGFLKPFDLA